MMILTILAGGISSKGRLGVGLASDCRSRGGRTIRELCGLRRAGDACLGWRSAASRAHGLRSPPLGRRRAPRRLIIVLHVYSYSICAWCAFVSAQGAAGRGHITPTLLARSPCVAATKPTVARPLHRLTLARLPDASLPPGVDFRCQVRAFLAWGTGGGTATPAPRFTPPCTCPAGPCPPCICPPWRGTAAPGAPPGQLPACTCCGACCCGG